MKSGQSKYKMEGFDDIKILNVLEDKGVLHAFSMLTPEIAKLGHLRGNDILSGFCVECETDEEAFDVARKIIGIGYVYHLETPNTAYPELARDKRWKLFHFLMNISGAYKDLLRIRTLIDDLDQRNIDPFLYRGVYPHKRDFNFNNDYEKFLTFRTAREKARIASIALIGVAKKLPYRSALDVMRVISRVVWSERCDKKWSENRIKKYNGNLVG